MIAPGSYLKDLVCLMVSMTAPFVLLVKLMLLVLILAVVFTDCCDCCDDEFEKLSQST